MPASVHLPTKLSIALPLRPALPCAVGAVAGSGSGTPSRPPTTPPGSGDAPAGASTPPLDGDASVRGACGAAEEAPALGGDTTAAESAAAAKAAVVVALWRRVQVRRGGRGAVCLQPMRLHCTRRARAGGSPHLPSWPYRSPGAPCSLRCPRCAPAPCLLQRFMRALLGSPVLLSALLALELEGSHPVVEESGAQGLDWTVAQMLALHLKSGRSTGVGGDRQGRACAAGQRAAAWSRRLHK